MINNSDQIGEDKLRGRRGLIFDTNPQIHFSIRAGLSSLIYAKNMWENEYYQLKYEELKSQG